MKVPVRRKTEQMLRDELQEAKADVTRTRRVSGIAMRDALQLSALVDAVCHSASAAEAYLAAGATDSAKDVLAIIKRAHIDSLRARVAREPGGIHYESTPNGSVNRGE